MSSVHQQSSNFSSNYKVYQNNQTLSTPENVIQFNDDYNSNMHYGLTMWLDEQEDCFLPFSNINLDINNFLFSENNVNNQLNCYSSNPNSMMDIPGFGNSSLEYFNSQIKEQSPNSSGSSTTTYDDFENNTYNTLQNRVPSSNNYAATPQYWGFQGHTTQVCGSENNSSSSNNNTKVRKYSVEEKKDRILRYLNKRHQRNFRKTIKYACRKTLADRRVRIRGRFAKNQEEESSTDNNNNHSIFTQQHETAALPLYNTDYKKEQCNDMNEEWLQETMASLLYVPCISAGWHPEIHRS